MSPIARALHERFDLVCRSELDRLRRKTACLSPADRAEVDAITVELTRAIAARVGAALEQDADGDLQTIVARLFAVSFTAAGGPADGVGL
ncbi:MAG TPA: hypothetical protein VD833_23750 [Vicinamibacterales bacterium]|nr:hypothetical protein [Vicinamibacterales bacterium]